MADAGDTKEEEKQEKTDGKASGGGILLWIRPMPTSLGEQNPDSETSENSNAV